MFHLKNSKLINFNTEFDFIEFLLEIFDFKFDKKNFIDNNMIKIIFYIRCYIYSNFSAAYFFFCFKFSRMFQCTGESLICITSVCAANGVPK